MSPLLMLTATDPATPYLPPLAPETAIAPPPWTASVSVWPVPPVPPPGVSEMALPLSASSRLAASLMCSVPSAMTKYVVPLVRPVMSVPPPLL